MKFEVRSVKGEVKLFHFLLHPSKSGHIFMDIYFKTFI